MPIGCLLVGRVSYTHEVLCLLHYPDDAVSGRTCFGEAFEEGLVCTDDLWAGAVLEGFDQDGVAVIVIEEKQIAIARTRGKRELPGEIGVDLARFLYVGYKGVQFVGLVGTIRVGT